MILWESCFHSFLKKLIKTLKWSGWLIKLCRNCTVHDLIIFNFWSLIVETEGADFDFILYFGKLLHYRVIKMIDMIDISMEHIYVLELALCLLIFGVWLVQVFNSVLTFGHLSAWSLFCKVVQLRFIKCFEEAHLFLKLCLLTVLWCADAGHRNGSSKILTVNGTMCRR